MCSRAVNAFRSLESIYIFSLALSLLFELPKGGLYPPPRPRLTLLSFINIVLRKMIDIMKGRHGRFREGFLLARNLDQLLACFFIDQLSKLNDCSLLNDFFQV